MCVMTARNKTKARKTTAKTSKLTSSRASTLKQLKINTDAATDLMQRYIADDQPESLRSALSDSIGSAAVITAKLDSTHDFGWHLGQAVWLTALDCHGYRGLKGSAAKRAEDAALRTYRAVVTEVLQTKLVG
jgi:hypothetical protein